MARAKATILCIDDHWKELIARKALLEQNGYRVLEAIYASEGIHLFLTHSVDAVILDYQLPGTSGDHVASYFKQLKPNVPILLLSAYAPLPKKKLQSVDSFLWKSEPSRVLLATLHDMLNGWSKPFFHRWLDQWKGRIYGVRP